VYIGTVIYEHFEAVAVVQGVILRGG